MNSLQSGSELTYLCEAHSAPEKRSAYWDNCKGLLIALVVLGHCLILFPQLNLVFVYVYSFHMPAFLFVSGYFSLKNPARRDKLLRIFLMFIVMNIMLMLCLYGSNVNEYQWLMVYSASWYLLALFIYRLVTPLLLRFRLIPFFACSVLLGCLVCRFECSDAFDLCGGPQTTARKLIGLLPFFVAGLWFGREKKMASGFTNPSILKKCIGVGIFFALFVCVYLGRQHGLFSCMLWGESRLLPRVVSYVCGFVGIGAMLLVVPHSRCRLLTRWGEASLAIYFWHRPFTFLLGTIMPMVLVHFSTGKYSYLLGSLFTSLLLLLVLSAPIIMRWTTYPFDAMVRALSGANSAGLKALIRSLAAYSVLIVLFVFPPAARVAAHSYEYHRKHEDVFISVLNHKQEQLLSKCFRVTFLGDLILLRAQVQRGHHQENDSYDFHEMFQPVKAILQSDDATIGVFEGPCAGPEKSYSTSDFDDNIPIYLNFPDTFADAVKDAGIDIVTLANNHLLDGDMEAVGRTCKLLDEIGLKHVGVLYPVVAKRPTPLYVELQKNGHKIKAAVLAYTYGVNNCDDNSLYMGKYAGMTALLASPRSQYYKLSMDGVKEDFRAVREMKPDVVIVLAHMGTQFAHEPDALQKHWNQVFIDEGADVVLSDHAHTPQPIKWAKGSDGRNVLL